MMRVSGSLGVDGVGDLLQNVGLARLGRGDDQPRVPLPMGAIISTTRIVVLPPSPRRKRSLGSMAISRSKGVRALNVSGDRPQTDSTVANSGPRLPDFTFPRHLNTVNQAKLFDQLGRHQHIIGQRLKGKSRVPQIAAAATAGFENAGGLGHGGLGSLWVGRIVMLIS